MQIIVVIRLLVTKVGTGLPPWRHNIDTFAVCLELFASSFCDQQEKVPSPRGGFPFASLTKHAKGSFIVRALEVADTFGQFF